ncbi:MAG: ATP phosphoribosyltransferase regulatory subunit [archaeon]
MNTVKGFRDYAGEEALKREEIRKILVEIFVKYGFNPAETPVIESEEFVRGDNTNDEAVSDIFKLKDKGKRKLALRYELTFPLKRLMKNQKLPYRRYQIGPVFRDEPIQGNRSRQFISCDVDVVGSTVKDEAEILATAKSILDKLKIENIIFINNRKLMNEVLEDNGIKKNKEQVLREIDKYDKLPEKEIRASLKKLKAENVLDSIKKGEKYFSQFDSYKEVISLMDYCKNYGVKVLFSPTIVRGLSYYNGTVFEIKSNIKETIFGGGAYIFNEVQCVGYGVSIERLSMVAKFKTQGEKYLVVSLEQDKQAIKIAEKLRKKGKVVSIYYGKPSKALQYANSYDIDNVIFVGEKEIKSKKFKVKDMKSGKESYLK